MLKEPIYIIEHNVDPWESYDFEYFKSEENAKNRCTELNDKLSVYSGQSYTIKKVNMED